MNATVITVGNELLTGQTVNTNLSFIAQHLRKTGVSVVRALAIKDEAKAIHDALKNVDTELIIFTGGLGPTQDDLTKESVCAFFSLPLERNAASLERIQQTFNRVGRPMSETNLKQADFPKEAIIINNDVGTAPGAIIAIEDKTIVLLPGPPSEMRPMFPFVIDYLKERTKQTLMEAGYLLVGIPEADIEGELKAMYKAHPDVNIAPYANLSEIKVMFNSEDPNALERALDDFKKVFSTYIVGPHNHTLEKLIVETLIAQDKTISFAESCTAGMLSARLVNVPNASHVFKESLVLYSNHSKIKHLGVNNIIMEKYGAVSDQCVYELAYQLAQRTNASITMSVSGIAGPSGGTATKPVGTVYYGLHHEGKTKTTHRVFSGDRAMVRSKATTYGLYLILKALRHEDNHS